MKRFLILQLRPETDASDAEYASILARSDLSGDHTHRIRLDREPLPEDLDITGYGGVIVGGGPGCISDAPDKKSATEARVENAILSLMPQIIETDHPFMGCCYGLGILAHHLGGAVSKTRFAEPVGPSDCTLTLQAADDPLMAGLPAKWPAFVGHKEAVQALPGGCVHLVASPPCPFQMIRHGANVYATQFHPEADAHDFEQRIRIYKDHGYFPPDQAETLIARCHDATVTVPGEILRRFVRRFG